MTPAEIKKEIDLISKMMKRLGDIDNDLWVEKNKLMNEYKRLRGESI